MYRRCHGDAAVVLSVVVSIRNKALLNQIKTGQYLLFYFLDFLCHEHVNNFAMVV